MRACAICVALVAVVLGVVYSGFLAHSGALQWVDTWDPKGRGMRFLGETPWLVPQPWRFNTSDIPDLTGKTIVLTGANSGLGYWTAVHLFRANATVVLACRTAHNCVQAKEDIIAEGGPGAISPPRENLVESLPPLNLASFASARAFAADFSERFATLDSLILNAGVMLVPFGRTEDGLELTMGTNHFGHFLLAMLLAPKLEAAATAGASGVATVSVHSSAAHFEGDTEEGLMREYLSPLGDGVGPDSEPVWYDPASAYFQSKLANVLFAQELAKRFQQKGVNVLVNAHAPGAVRTNLLSHVVGEMDRDGPVFGGGGKIELMLGKWGRYLLFKYVMPLHRVVWDPEQASLTQVFTAVATELVEKRITGRYFQSVARELAPDPHCRNQTLQAWLWKQSELVTQASWA